MGLSVVIPCHNVESTIAEQLDALLAQEWSGEWEVVVVDNRSTDGTRTIVSELTVYHPRLRIVEAMERQSIAYARNTGIRSARFDSIAICDGDDVVGSGWVAAMGEALVEHELVAGRLDVHHLNPPWLAATRGSTIGGVSTFNDAFARVPGCNHGLRRRVWEKLGGFDESFSNLETVEDMDFSLRAWQAGIEAWHAPEALVFYRYRTDARSLWRQGRSYGRGRVRIARWLRAAGHPVPRFPGWKSWLWLVLSAPAAVTPRRFKAWLWVAANRLGHVDGSLRYRILHL
jgi:glycosyltransferase involved in cell wall biosynthesis